MREQPTMTNEEFRDAQKRLGLTDSELALVLGISNDQHIRRLKSAPDKGHHKPVQPWHVRLIRAYLDGYRPKDWPATGLRRVRKAPPIDESAYDEGED